MIPRVLTIAGSDPGGGAGIQADLKTFTVFKVFGMSAITAVTVQNTRGVLGFTGMSPRLVSAQISAVLEDIGADAVKIGMLADTGVIRAVSRQLKKFRPSNIVLDPVMTAKSGRALLPDSAVKALVKDLLGLALIVTPNAPEASRLSGLAVRDPLSAREAAKAIHALGPKYVLIKGGHLGGPVCRDLLFDGTNFREFPTRRIFTRNTHGTGCPLAAAIAACLAKGMKPPAAVENARAFVVGAIKNSFSLGNGHGPLNHFWRLRDQA
jgi:hydroxymethylpyrimidine/phosphomethylpyrimidine kinase